MNKAEQLREVLKRMHKKPVKHSGAYWRGECADGCDACEAIALLDQLHPVVLNPCARPDCRRQKIIRSITQRWSPRTIRIWWITTMNINRRQKAHQLHDNLPDP